MKYHRIHSILLVILLAHLISCKPDTPDSPGTMQLIKATAGSIILNPEQPATGVLANAIVLLEFSNPLDSISAKQEIVIQDSSGSFVPIAMTFSDDLSEISLDPLLDLSYQSSYYLAVGNGLVGINDETFAGVNFELVTEQGKMLLKSLLLNGSPLAQNKLAINIDFRNAELNVEFSAPLKPDDYSPYFSISGGARLVSSLSADGLRVALKNEEPLAGYTRYYFSISNSLTSANGFTFDGYANSFYTALDSTPKFPLISDEELIELVQQVTFRYFWENGHPSCGLARERNSSGDIVTIGGSGFGVMALIVAMERGFVTRSEGLTRLDTILGFLETCDRFHGVWPHWVNGKTGKTVPFSAQDNGGDLVETSFMIQGLLAMREYLDNTVTGESLLVSRITSLWETVEWDWYTQNQNVLYWHWSPTNGFAMNHQIRGHNETLITYVLAASSPTHPIKASAYHNGYAGNGSIKNGRKFYGITLPLGWDYGGPLFFTHYSFLGLDPRNLADQYANYWEQNVNHSLINYNYCITNPKSFIGFSADCWGLTASDNQSGYSAHSPTNDKGVISPTAAVSSIAYTPEQSIRAIRHFYYRLGDKLWGNCGFYDAFNITQGWWANSYLAIDQGPMICMIENYRTGLLWNLFMKSTDVQTGLGILGFTF